MTYYESAEDQTISKKRAIRELEKHGISTEEQQQFFEEVGNREEYSAQEVLVWLGY